MSGERFTLDTNILVYAGDHRDPVKQTLASEIVRRSVGCDCRLTIQAVMEFHAAAVGKLRVAPVVAAAAANRHAVLFPTIAPTLAAARRALEAAALGTFSHWDALLLATAEEAGCLVALSEDMRDGARLGRIVVRNPFAGDRLSTAATAVLGL